MNKIRTFDFYEFVGIIIPGTIFLFSVFLLYPEIKTAFFSQNLTIGDLGIFVILAYAAGHLIQAIGNAIEWVWWKAWDGMPTDWIRQGKGNLLAAKQIQAIEQQLPSKLGLKSSISLKKTNAADWFNVTRQIYGAVSAQSLAERIDIFNGNYGLNRGISAALLIVSILTIVQDQSLWFVALMIFIGACIALYRMHRFGKHYARELFVQFLQLSTK